MRYLLNGLFKGHNAIGRGARKASFKSEMCGFGPRYDRWKKAQPRKVSFYTFKEKLMTLLPQINARTAFSDMVDKFCHVELAETIFGMFAWTCPSLLAYFLKFLDHFLAPEDYDVSNLEKEAGLTRLYAYQLFITRDYYSRIHVDDDISEFTLIYVWHPDFDQSSDFFYSDHSAPIDLVLVPSHSERARLSVKDGDNLAVHSSIPHGTARRASSAHSAYMGCVAVNSYLGNLMTRRRRVYA
jgi:hypothetical protein